MSDEPHSTPLEFQSELHTGCLGCFVGSSLTWIFCCIVFFRQCSATVGLLGGATIRHEEVERDYVLKSVVEERAIEAGLEPETTDRLTR